MRNERDAELAARVEAWRKANDGTPPPKRFRAKYKRHKAKNLTLEQL